MRKLFLFFCCILYSQLYSQTHYTFNVELNDKSNAPTFTRSGNVLVYNGSNPTDAAFFANYTINEFYQTYPNYSGYLVNMFTVITTSSTLMNDLKTQFPAKYLKTENLTGMKVELLSTYPNDYGNGVNYYNPVTNLGANLSMKALDYVNCPKAWGFFPNNKGNVSIGVSDGMINNSDADFGSKVSYIHLGGFISSPYNCSNGELWHGTGVGAIVAAQGNNAHGMAGVCYDCKIINSPYGYDCFEPLDTPPDFSGLMEMADLGVTVINMSWFMYGPKPSTPTPNDTCGYCTDPTYQDGFIQSVQDAIDQLHAKNVVLVAAAGNETSAWLPNDKYVYPASYNHVISVTTVHAKNHNLTDELTGPIPTYGYVSNYNEDVICVNGGIGPDPSNPVFVPFIEWSTTTNSRVDICGPAYAPIYSSYIMGCPGLYGDTTSCATPFVTGTVALMQSLNSCILASEVEDVLQLCSKNIEKNPANTAFIGRSGSGKLETGDAVEFTYEMMNPSGNAVIDGQDFWRFDFDLRHINHNLTISNQIFRDNNTSNFIARDAIDLSQNVDLMPNSNGFVDLKIDTGLTVCVPPSKTESSSIQQDNEVRNIKNAALYPNPNKGTFSIMLSQKEVKNLEVTVFDVIGKPVYQTKVDQNEFELSLSNLPGGIYMVKLSSNAINETLKFIKE
jgi:hypothetical protein